MLDSASRRIATYRAERSLPFLEPVALVYAPIARRGIPYLCIGLPVQTCVLADEDSSGRPPQEKSLRYKTPPQIPSNQYGIGQAPTNGIYTGVEEY